MNYSNPAGLSRGDPGDGSVPNSWSTGVVAQQIPAALAVAPRSTAAFTTTPAGNLEGSRSENDGESVPLEAAGSSNVLQLLQLPSPSIEALPIPPRSPEVSLPAEDENGPDEASSDLQDEEAGPTAVPMFLSVGEFVCKASPGRRILASMRFGAIKGAIVGGVTGAGAGGIGAVPGAVVGGVIGAAGGVFSGGAIAVGCSIVRGYPSR